MICEYFSCFSRLFFESVKWSEISLVALPFSLSLRKLVVPPVAVYLDYDPTKNFFFDLSPGTLFSPISFDSAVTFLAQTSDYTPPGGCPILPPLWSGYLAWELVRIHTPLGSSIDPFFIFFFFDFLLLIFCHLCAPFFFPLTQPSAEIQRLFLV